MKYETIDVHVEGNAYEAKRDGKSLIKITLSKFPSLSNAEQLGSFFLPMSTYDMGRTAFTDAIKARAKHDLKIIIGHYSSCGW